MSKMDYISNGKHGSSSAPANTETNRIEPPSLERMNWLIHLQHVRGEINSCKELIKREIAKCNGRNEFLYYKQGVILRDEGKVQEALESFQKCVKLNSENPDNIKEVAKCLYLLRRFRLALEAYLEAERSSSKQDWEIYYNVGQCLLRLAEISKAKEYVSRSVQIGKQECTYELLMKILVAEKDVNAAISVCNAAIETCPDSVNMLTESGLLYLKSGQTQLAFERLSAALALEPQCSKALLGIGCITQKHEEYDVALSKYKVALQSEPEATALWNNIGMCFYSKQKYIAAVTCLKRALWLSPLNWKVLFNLGLVHLSTYQPASAFNFLCAAVNLRPDVGLSFAIFGCALLELNDPENAFRAFKQSLSLNPEDPFALVNTEICLLKALRDGEAVEISERLRLMAENGVKIPKEVLDVQNRLSQLLPNSESEKGVATLQEEMKNDRDDKKDENDAKPSSSREFGPDEV